MVENENQNKYRSIIKIQFEAKELGTINHYIVASKILYFCDKETIL